MQSTPFIRIWRNLILAEAMKNTKIPSNFSFSIFFLSKLRVNLKIYKTFKGIKVILSCLSSVLTPEREYYIKLEV
jgi:hypothetical protein